MDVEVKPYRVLVCDDQADVLEALRLLLKGQGWQAVAVDSPDALMHKVRSEVFDLILVDLNYTRDTTSGAEGMDLLSSLEKQGNRRTEGVRPEALRGLRTAMRLGT